MAHLADDGERILDALMAMVVVDGEIDRYELAQVKGVYVDLTGETLDPAALASRAARRLHSDDPAQLHPDLGVGLDEGAKRRVMAAAYAVAEADGFVLEEEDQLLLLLSRALGLSEDVYRLAMSGLLSTSSS